MSERSFVTVVHNGGACMTYCDATFSVDDAGRLSVNSIADRRVLAIYKDWDHARVATEKERDGFEKAEAALAKEETP